jgi:hypothetical protein
MYIHVWGGCVLRVWGMRVGAEVLYQTNIHKTLHRAEAGTISVIALQRYRYMAFSRYRGLKYVRL